MPETSAAPSGSSSSILDQLPLRQTISETVPPAPNLVGSAIDFLPDFSSYGWIAYGASSLLVISHLPSPASDAETQIGPIMRKTIELGTYVTSVAWSPATPSTGEVAAAAGNRITVFSHESETSLGYCGWRQSGSMVGESKVEVVKWTGSGDGIVAGGEEVVLWTTMNGVWEVVWKFRTEVPQCLISTTWSVDGTLATAMGSREGFGESNKSSEARNFVNIWRKNEKLEYVKDVLEHPLMVTLVHWKPWKRRKLDRDARHSGRDVLMTSSEDGSVRLWCENDNVRDEEDFDSERCMRYSFHVAAVIDVNKVLNGTLGSDVFMMWATELQGLVKTPEGSHCFSLQDSAYKSGITCEWIVGIGPGSMITFWAVFSHDENSPDRFPRVTLWKRQEVPGLNMLSGYRIGGASSNEQAPFSRIYISRNHISAPPTVCSVVHLLPYNSVGWSVLYTPVPSDAGSGSPIVNKKSNIFSCQAYKVIGLDGHSGKIVDVAVHPDGLNHRLAVSLDSNGIVIFWSLSAINHSSFGLPTMKPSWKICGKLFSDASSPKYTCIIWAPSVLDEDLVVLMGHAEGVDCCIVEVVKDEDETIICHKICTIPIHTHHADGPSCLSAIPIPSTHTQNIYRINFVLLAVWTGNFEALSWKVSLHSSNISESGCGCEDGSVYTSKNLQRFESTPAEKRYCALVHPCASHWPQSHELDQITSSAVICNGSSNSCWLRNCSSDYAASYPPYHMAVGYVDGTVRLWRSSVAEVSTSSDQWKMVGTFSSDLRHISAISSTDCGKKIATAGFFGNSTTSMLQIWECLHLVGSGNVVLEDTIPLDTSVVALRWLTTGTGQLLLGVCMPTKIQIFTQKRCGGQSLLSNETPLKVQIWCCLASTPVSPPVTGFLWGHGATLLVIHDYYFKLLGQWSCHPYFTKGEPTANQHGTAGWNLKCSVKVNADTYFNVNCGSPISILQLAEKLIGTLPMYHPESLIANICSGNGKRAHLALKFLIDGFTSERGTGTQSSFAAPLIPLSDYFEAQETINYAVKERQRHGDNASSTNINGFPVFAYGSEYDVPSIASSSRNFELSKLNEQMEKLISLGYVTIVEKFQTYAVMDLLNEISSHAASVYGSLDEPGRRFWVAIKFQLMFIRQRSGLLPSIQDLTIDSSIFSWAFHSDCQENLFSSILPNEPSWSDMRAIGLGFWFTDTSQLRMKMEKLARLQYLKKKDPKDCALLYVTLNRTQVLAGLFKISRDEKDKPLVGFLSRNFQEEKNKVAAIKNAYVLMGRHQLELAITFFLLGGDISSAINVCVKNLGDVQLALVICRLREGHGGPLKSHLLSNILLPTAVEKGDYWLQSLFEWELGNYSRSFVAMLGAQQQSMPIITSSSAAFLDPSIGWYCILLATKNSMRNALGERKAAVLSKWASLITAIALNRCGLPLEGLESLSSSHNLPGERDQGHSFDIPSTETLWDILHVSSSKFSNWLSGGVSCQLESQGKLDLALKYFTKLIEEAQSSWVENDLATGQVARSAKEDSCSQYEMPLKTFTEKLYSGLRFVEHKFSLGTVSLIDMMAFSLCNSKLPVLAYAVLHEETTREHSQDQSNILHSYPGMRKLLIKSAKEISCTVSRFTLSCSVACSQPGASCSENAVVCETASYQSAAWCFYMQDLLHSLWAFRSCFRTCAGATNQGIKMKTYMALDMLEYCVYFASAWSQKNVKGLILLLQTFLSNHKPVPYEVEESGLQGLRGDILEVLVRRSLKGAMLDSLQGSGEVHNSEGGEDLSANERWKIVGACLWRQISTCMRNQLDAVFENVEDPSFCNGNTSELPQPTDDNFIHLVRVVSAMTMQSLGSMLHHFSSYHAKMLGSSLLQRLDNQQHLPLLDWLLKCIQSQSKALEHLEAATLSLDYEDKLWNFARLWDTVVDMKIITEGFAQENIHLLLESHRPPRRWNDIYNDIHLQFEKEDSNTQELERESGSLTGLFWNASSFFTSLLRNTTPKEDLLFQSPKEIYKGNGELFEALCVNSIDQRQAAVASNKKGILFFQWDDGSPVIDQTEYIWPEAYSPKYGQPESSSVSSPTHTPSGVSIMSPKVVVGGPGAGNSTGNSGRELVLDNGYGVSWDSEENLIGRSASVNKISSRAFSSHPSRPLFLVGSTNRHIYLWEFGKDMALAKYGVSDTNATPPHAIPPISALEFDACGHGFTTAALDGTISTWELEARGSGNIRPTKSLSCFNGYASDVTYVTTSGSIVAASGHSSGNFNAVLWDTLAPPSISRVSIRCHEGGAHSIAVIDDGIARGSMPPLIVTGGKDGGIGVHDFRYVAAGKMKKDRTVRNIEQDASFSGGTNSPSKKNIGEQNADGMLWYIPKAHLGTVTRIAAIPNTSLFLTGSKDGDVKLWDVKRSRMVYHWRQLHERHTFLQANTRGYGGVVQAAVTDINVISRGFLTCGGDGSVKFTQLKDHLQGT